jgi:hypothetical protein
MRLIRSRRIPQPDENPLALLFDPEQVNTYP